MDAVSHGSRRYQLYYGSTRGPEGYALTQLYAALQQHLPYVLTAYGPQQAPDVDCDAVLIGTCESNPHLARLVEQGFLTPPTRTEGYCLYVGRSPYRPDRDAIVILGYDASGVLYGVRDLEHEYLAARRYAGQYWVKIRPNPLEHPLDPWGKASSPAIENRGIWCWGHTVYDYRGFIDNMTRAKLNTLILWNDFVPINAPEVVAYAHSRGVKLIWGFTWCWGETVHPGDQEVLAEWTQRVIETYEHQYLPAGGDGVYFQIFTETSDKEIDGHSIAALASQWVNAIAGKLLERHPNLWIQFGLHATSVNDRLEQIASVDPRVNITWEDCGGFPYHYDPRKSDDPKATLAFTRKIATLRGGEDFGAVLKAMVCLDWPHFEHQKGPFLLGETDPVWRAERARHQAYFWKQANPCWMKQLPLLQDFVRLLRDLPNRRTTLTALAEDGMLEASLPAAVALLGEALWDPDQADMVGKVMLCPDVTVI